MCHGWKHPSLPVPAPLGQLGENQPHVPVHMDTSCKSWDILLNSGWTQPFSSRTCAFLQGTVRQGTVIPPEKLPLHILRTCWFAVANTNSNDPTWKVSPGMLRTPCFAHCCCKHNTPVPTLSLSTHSQQHLPEGFAFLFT